MDSPLKKLTIIPLAFWMVFVSSIPVLPAAEDLPLRSFEVQATSTNAYFIDEGKVKEEDTGDQVVYFVDLPNKTVKRMAVYYAQKKKKKGETVVSAGLHAQPLNYAVVHYQFDFMKKQRLIKALAQTQNDDGFETLVIGEDFVASSVSTKGYFTVTYYERTDADALAFKKRNGKVKEEKAQAYQAEDEQTAVGWVSDKFENFNRWRRQKGKRSYTD